MRSTPLNLDCCSGCTVTQAELDRAIAVLDALPDYAVPAGELGIVLMDEAPHCALHERYLQDPSPTDVITFPGDPSEDLAGEIILNVDLAQREAHRFQQTPSEELTLYLVHGYLHLAGFDDQTDDQRSAMRHAEQFLLYALKDARAMPDFRFSGCSDPRLPASDS